VTQSITVSWPTSPLSDSEWAERLEDLAKQAEAMVGRRQTLQAQAELALAWFGVAWPVLSPETIAASCRASLLVGAPGVLAVTAPIDQLAEIHSRLDDLWEQAQADPAAGAVALRPPLLELPPKAPQQPRKQRVKASDLEEEQQPAADLEPVAAELVQATAAAPELQDMWQTDPLMPVENVMSDQEFEALVMHSDHAPGPAEPEPAPAPPADWLTAAEAAELLDVPEVTIGQWRDAGKFGAQGEGWVKVGVEFYYAPAAVEQLEAEQIPAGLDGLLADVQGG
jgi:hypothetical protein